jgi:hypothetical protein
MIVVPLSFEVPEKEIAAGRAAGISNRQHQQLLWPAGPTKD